MTNQPPAFLNRGAAITWLQGEAVRQAQQKYGPGVRTSIGRSTDPRVLCNYLELDERDVLPAAVREREAHSKAAGAQAQPDREAGG